MTLQLLSSARWRRGLAPLELVLSLPLLLMVMGLMINFGTAASWKVRAAMVARDAVWSSRWPRPTMGMWPSIGTTPQPANWPNNAGRNIQGGAPVAVLDDPSIDQPVARGPNLGQTTVNRNLLDPTRGLRVGTATIQMPMPLMPTMLAPINFSLTHSLLDDAFQIQTPAMNQPAPQARQSSNNDRRETILYQFAQPDPSLAQNYVNAVVQIWFAPFQPQLAVLDQDQEIFNYYGAFRDFHPRLNGFCGLNVQGVHKNDVLPLIDRIQGRKKPHVAGVPETLARAFINMYQGEINNLKAAGGNQAQIQALQGTIKTLQKFIASL